MQTILGAFFDIALLIDLAISLAALIFMCASIYAMQWLPGQNQGPGTHCTQGESGAPLNSNDAAEACVLVDADVLSGVENEKGVPALLLDERE